MLSKIVLFLDWYGGYTPNEQASNAFTICFFVGIILLFITIGLLNKSKKVYTKDEKKGQRLRIEGIIFGVATGICALMALHYLMENIPEQPDHPEYRSVERR